MMYLMRHGEIQGAEIKRYIGRTDVPLSPLGVRQAEAWHSVLKPVRFHGVVASPLGRTVQTAAIVSGLPVSSVTRCPILSEIDLGEWDGLPVSDIRRTFSLAWEQRGKDIAGYRPPGGESFGDLQDRVLPGFERLLQCALENNYLVVAHAGVNRVILAHLLGQPLDSLFQIPQAYAALNLITCSSEGGSVSRMNLSVFDFGSRCS